MPDLTNTVRWVTYVPALLGNREAMPRPFWLELNGSLSKEQMQAIQEALRKPAADLTALPDTATVEEQEARRDQERAELVERYAKALEPFVRFGKEPLTIGGQPITTLAQYLGFVSKTLPLVDFLEPSRALFEVNVLGVREAFFSERLSGGFTSTTPRSAEKVGSQTAAR